MFKVMDKNIAELLYELQKFKKESIREPSKLFQFFLIFQIMISKMIKLFSYSVRNYKIPSTAVNSKNLQSQCIIIYVSDKTAENELEESEENGSNNPDQLDETK